MATIKLVDGRSIHQIQSGQVIVDLCSVVKELVENSVDAGATTIDVRFKNQGLDLIEIQDNGSGISPVNYESVALKHHTSKLSSFSDISSLDTYGFRGEALASLCALSTVTITTCISEHVPKGAKLTFESSGKLKSKSLMAAQRGTTVAVENLFHNLPVRRRELERNIKREWLKVVTLLNQYACILTQLKFSVSQQPSKGKRILLFSTKGNQTTKDNIINIFGAKTMAALVSLELKLEIIPTKSGLAQTGDSQVDASREVRVFGHVSRPVHGEGRQTPDRQMFFVNGRPCGLPQFAKTFNNVYKSYNYSQSPFILADIRMDTNMYDVNVSPDKRSILLHDQDHLLESLRAALVELFDQQDYTVPVAQAFSTPGRATPKPTTAYRATPAIPVSTSRLRNGPNLPDESIESSSHDSQSSDSESVPARPPETPNISTRSNSDAQNLISRWATKASSSKNTPATRITTPAQQTSISARFGRNEEISELAKSMRVRDFNQRLAEQMPIETHQSVPGSPLSGEPADSVSPEVMAEPPIPAIHPVRQVDGTPRTRVSRSLKRNVAEPITVTIGDSLHTQVVISPSKRRKKNASVGDETQMSLHKVSKDDELQNSVAAGDVEEDAAGDKSASEAEEDCEPELGQQPEPEGQNDSLEDEEEDGSIGDESAENGSINNQLRCQDEEDEEEDEGDQEQEQGREEDEEEEEDDVAETDDGEEPGNEEDGSATSVKTNSKRASLSRSSSSRQKGATVSLIQHVDLDSDILRVFTKSCIDNAPQIPSSNTDVDCVEDMAAADAESKLQLIISKGDFERMRVAGQFNMGFIIAVRPGSGANADADAGDDGSTDKNDELFIIDQHASDEKYNFERLIGSTVVQSQRLVTPKTLELTAVEEEVVMERLAVFEANGFKIEVDTSGDTPVGSRCVLTTLPLSRETAFGLEDLEELIAILCETPAGIDASGGADNGDDNEHQNDGDGDGDYDGESSSLPPPSPSSSSLSNIPRPSKVRKMFAMRACRSSVMIGKSLMGSQMEDIVRHLGELEKPWSCPHGRPTMRHLCSLRAWDEQSWRGDTEPGSAALWKAFANGE